MKTKPKYKIKRDASNSLVIINTKTKEQICYFMSENDGYVDTATHENAELVLKALNNL